MPKTLQEIIEHADDIAAAFENYEPDPQDRRPAAPLKHASAAVRARAEAEKAVAVAVREMRQAGYSWAAIGSVLGTSAEAARQRYGAEREPKERAPAARGARRTPTATTSVGSRAAAAKAKSTRAVRVAAKSAAVSAAPRAAKSAKAPTPAGARKS